MKIRIWESLLLLTLLEGAIAAQVHVDDDAIGPFDGSPAFPFATIADGIAAALPGDTVYVASGTYEEYDLVLTDGVNVQGAPDLTTVVCAPTAPPNTDFGQSRFLFESVESSSTLKFLVLRDAPNAVGFGTDNSTTGDAAIG